VIAQREFLHPLEDEQLDLGNLAEAERRRGFVALDHGTGT
jgi:hypothetical protein